MLSRSILNNINIKLKYSYYSIYVPLSLTRLLITWMHPYCFLINYANGSPLFPLGCEVFSIFSDLTFPKSFIQILIRFDSA